MPFPYKIVYSNRKTLALSVKTDASVLVRSPNGVDPYRIEQFIMSKTGWVLKTLEKVKVLYRCDSRFCEGGIFKYLGESYVLVLSDELFDGVKMRGNELLISRNNANGLEEVIHQWYQSSTREVIFERVPVIAERMGLLYGGLKISNARRSWGTCTSKKVVLFSWRLMQFPLSVIDYVIIHELAHLVELNHSDHFWTIVERYCPDYKERRSPLKHPDPLLIN